MLSVVIEETNDKHLYMYGKYARPLRLIDDSAFAIKINVNVDTITPPWETDTNV